MGAAGAVRERNGGGQENGVQPTGGVHSCHFFMCIKLNKYVHLEKTVTAVPSCSKL